MRSLNRMTLAVVMGMVACPGGVNVEAARKTLTPHTVTELQRFESTAQFDAYVSAVKSVQPMGWGGPFGCAAPSSSMASASAPQESITNNQEQGVDEGDIVKAAGDYLVVLRRGRLFTIRVGTADAPTLTPVAKIDVPPPGYTQGTWYDEMLISGDRVAVIGFSYQQSATEVGLFRLAADGTLSHDGHFLLRSNDYYSSRNYASRLLGTKLIFYMPYSLVGGGGGVSMPAMRRFSTEGALSQWADVLAKTETYRPLQLTSAPVLHTVVTCELADAAPTCTARAIIGPWSRTFYVSPDAVYLWVASNADALGATQANSLVYRLPLNDGEQVSVLGVGGAPVDQFSFQQRAGVLNVVVQNQGGGGDAMWAPEASAVGDLALARLPLSAFGTTPSAPNRAQYAALPQARSSTSYGTTQNRFIGDWLLYGVGEGWAASTDSISTGQVIAVPVEHPEQARPLQLTHQVDRLEPLGEGAALVVGQGDKALGYSAISLGDHATVASVTSEANATQGETRSHGFFFKPDGTGGGTLGLPVRLEGAAWQHLIYGSAEVAWYSLSPQLELMPRGALLGSQTYTSNDQCLVSCTDWYGNARPIFYRNRMFALMGYELIEGAMGASGIEELGRVEFLR